MNAPLSPLSAVSLHDTQIAIGPFMPEDAASLFLWLNDIDAANLDLAFRPIDWTAFQVWLADVGRNSSRVMFAIRKVSQPQILGYLALTNIHNVHRSAELGIRIPDDLSVVSFDDLYATVAYPPMTVVNQKMYDVGIKAVEVLMEMIRHPSAWAELRGERYKVPSELVIRRSTAPPRDASASQPS